MRILALSLGVITGTALQGVQSEPWPLSALGGVGLLLIIGAWGDGRLAPGPRQALWVWALTSLLAASGVSWRSQQQLAGALATAMEGQVVWLEGCVDSLPQAQTTGWRLELEVTHWRALPTQTLEGPRPSRVLLTGGHDAESAGSAPAAGECWGFAARLKAPHGNRNPGGFDAELWLWERGINATASVRRGRLYPPPVRLSPAPSWRMGVWRERVRQAIRSALGTHPQTGSVVALLVGDQASLSAPAWNLYRQTGVAHLMSISGLHITGLAWLATACVAWLWRRSDRVSAARPWALRWPTPWVAPWVGLGVACLYAAFSGWGLPAQRTLLMLALARGLQAMGKQWPATTGLVFIAAVLLSLDPWALFQAGFWLSFGAVALLMLGTAPEAANATRWGVVHRLVREQTLMSLGLAPLTLGLFQQFSVVGWLANLIAVPWVTLVVTPLCLLGLLWSGFWWAAATALDALTTGLALLAQWPLAVASLAARPTFLWGLALVGMGLAVYRGPAWSRALGLWAIGPFLFWQPARLEEGRFALLAADVGQGQAVLVRTRGHDLLYDTGPRLGPSADAGERIVVPWLRALGASPERVVLSHVDADHSGGLDTVMAAHPQAQLWASIPKDHPLGQRHAFVPCAAGQSWTWDGVQFSFWHPGPDTPIEASTNNRSCALRMEDAQGVVAWLVGDIEARAEAELIRRAGTALQGDWLLVPHHGSRTSSTPAFVAAVAPRWAVVQAGYLNPYRHPRADVLARYHAQGARVRTTVACGTLTWQSAKPEQMDCWRERAAPIWRHRQREVVED